MLACDVRAYLLRKRSAKERGKGWGDRGRGRGSGTAVCADDASCARACDIAYRDNVVHPTELSPPRQPTLSWPSIPCGGNSSIPCMRGSSGSIAGDRTSARWSHGGGGDGGGRFLVAREHPLSRLTAKNRSRDGREGRKNEEKIAERADFAATFTPAFPSPLVASPDTSPGLLAASS